MKSYLITPCIYLYLKVVSLYFFRNFRIVSLLEYLIHFELFLCEVKERDLFYSVFPHPVFYVPFVKNATVSPIYSFSIVWLNVRW